MRIPRARLESTQQDRLQQLIVDLKARNPFYQRKLASIETADTSTLLSALPFTTRAELEQDQLANPPYGSNLALPLGNYTRLHQTSGTNGRPLYWLDTPRTWAWFKNCWQAVFAAAGVSNADTVALTFSFGPFIGFWAAMEAAADLGCRVLPAGGMSSLARIQHILTHNATVLCCTPTYALHLAETARKESMDLRSGCVRVIVVAGEPGGNIPATRQRIEDAWGARVSDHAGMTELGAWGFELRDCPRGLHVLETEFIAEVIDPKTSQPLPAGAAGELVLTNLGRTDCPLVRYRTGDIVNLEPSPLPNVSFRWAPGGVLGRADDMLVIRGNNVFPSAIEDIVRTIDAIDEFRVRPIPSGPLVDLLIEVEPRPPASGESAAALLDRAIRNRLHFRAEIRHVAPGTLPRSEFKSRRMQRS